MPSSPLAKVQKQVADILLKACQFECRSKSVRDSLYVKRIDKDTLTILSRYYWAYWYHWGRGPVNQFVIYYPNKKNDPRTNGGTRYPRTLAQKKKLSKKRAKEDIGKGLAIKAESVGPTDGDPFFTRIPPGRLKNAAKKIAARELAAYVRERYLKEAQARLKSLKVTIF